MELELDLIEDDEFEVQESSPATKKGVRKSAVKDKSAKRFVCSVTGCSYSTPYKKDLVRHMRKHTGEKPYSCELCSKQFSRYDKLMGHTRSHEGLRSFRCDFPACDYSGIDSSALKRHVARVHSDEKPYTCQLCSYRSKDSTQMNIHVRFHTGDSPYICTACPRAFKTGTDLQRHSRIHTNEKPYCCGHCDFSTSLKCNLTAHVRRKHAQPSLPVTEVDSQLHILPAKPASKPNKNLELPFSIACKFCKFNTATLKSFKLHMVKRHKTKDYDSVLDDLAKPTKKQQRSKLLAPGDFASKFRCSAPECAATFVSKKSLRCHIRQHVTLRPPPAPTVEVVISAAASESESRLARNLETETIYLLAAPQHIDFEPLESNPSADVVTSQQLFPL